MDSCRIDVLGKFGRYVAPSRVRARSLRSDSDRAVCVLGRYVVTEIGLSSVATFTLSDNNQERGRVIVTNPYNQILAVPGSAVSDTLPPVAGGSLSEYFIGPEFEAMLETLTETDPRRYGTPPARRDAVEALADVIILLPGLQCLRPTLAAARSLRSDRDVFVLGRYLATELGWSSVAVCMIGRYVVTELGLCVVRWPYLSLSVADLDTCPLPPDNLFTLSDNNQERGRVIVTDPYNQILAVPGSAVSDTLPPVAGGSLSEYFIGPEFEAMLETLTETDPRRYGTPPARRDAVEALADVIILLPGLQCLVSVTDCGGSHGCLAKSPGSLDSNP
ncbi:hypothetical protein F2Q68_00043812 [Brassica cretica]|uniref:Uncharacterized protein n=1 Tax=Brassica cretica TaxID=69181 RepID=A0A8S9LL18_BRACR|nr:hypothetical protein F2Q68_00043812 [Brassica cretica]